MIGALTSIFSGVGTGLLGSVVTNVSDYFEQRRKNKHELAMRRLDIEEMDKDYEHRKDLKAQETQAVVQQKSYGHDARSYTEGMRIKSGWLKVPLVFVDFVRGLVRPALTVYLIVLVWLTFNRVEGVIDSAGMEAIKPQEALVIFAGVVDMILYLAATAVTWWYGTRPRSQQRKQD